jgi:hypothetical protein
MIVAVGFDTLTAIMMKIQVFDDIMPCCRVNIYILFEDHSALILQVT